MEQPTARRAGRAGADDGKQPTVGRAEKGGADYGKLPTAGRAGADERGQITT